MPLNEWLTSIADSGLSLLGRLRTPDHSTTRIISLCEDLISNRGEALGTAIAREVARTYGQLSDDERIEFFHWLKSELSPDASAILDAAQAFAGEESKQNLMTLMAAVQPPRQTLFRRINMAPGGTAVLVGMRQLLRRTIREQPELDIIDVDLKHLMDSWFNRGFLELRHINWETPADILEKIMGYESVHKMAGWHDLKRRLAADRRCFAFFHPAMPDEPLIFVEVALVKGLAGAIAPILDDPVNPDPGNTDHAVFYSINNCQAGLVGISFGNFLIKQVVMELQQELPHIKHFATLSPIPGFRKWLSDEISNDAKWIAENDEMEWLLRLEQEGKVDTGNSSIKNALTKACARYLYSEKKGNMPLDPVARFHLGNGASIGQLNYQGDMSANGLKTSWGMLANYRYELSKVEKNHEALVNDGIIDVSADIRKLIPA